MLLLASNTTSQLLASDTIKYSFVFCFQLRLRVTWARRIFNDENVCTMNDSLKLQSRIIKRRKKKFVETSIQLSLSLSRVEGEAFYEFSFPFSLVDGRAE